MIFFIDPIFQPWVTIGNSKDVTQIDPKFFDASFDILICERERERESEREREKESEREREKERKRKIDKQINR